MRYIVNGAHRNGKSVAVLASRVNGEKPTLQYQQQRRIALSHRPRAASLMSINNGARIL